MNQTNKPNLIIVLNDQTIAFLNQCLTHADFSNDNFIYRNIIGNIHQTLFPDNLNQQTQPNALIQTGWLNSMNSIIDYLKSYVLNQSNPKSDITQQFDSLIQVYNYNDTPGNYYARLSMLRYILEKIKYLYINIIYNHNIYSNDNLNGKNNVENIYTTTVALISAIDIINNQTNYIDIKYLSIIDGIFLLIASITLPEKIQSMGPISPPNLTNYLNSLTTNTIQDQLSQLKNMVEQPHPSGQFNNSSGHDASVAPNGQIGGSKKSDSKKRLSKRGSKKAGSKHGSKKVKTKHGSKKAGSKTKRGSKTKTGSKKAGSKKRLSKRGSKTKS